MWYDLFRKTIKEVAVIGGIKPLSKEFEHDLLKYGKPDPQNNGIYVYFKDLEKRTDPNEQPPQSAHYFIKNPQGTAILSYIQLVPFHKGQVIGYMIKNAQSNEQGKGYFTKLIKNVVNDIQVVYGDEEMTMDAIQARQKMLAKNDPDLAICLVNSKTGEYRNYAKDIPIYNCRIAGIPNPACDDIEKDIWLWCLHKPS